MSANKQQGLTFLELLITLTVATMLVLMSVPSISAITQTKADTEIQKLLRLSQKARSETISREEHIVLCGTTNGTDCERTWHNMKIIVFVDKNNNHRQDSGEPILHRTSIDGSYISWNGVRPYMRYRLDGTAIEYGTYTYCPDNRDNRHARQLTINAAGRPYLSRDNDHDGFHEDNLTHLRINCTSI